MASLGNLLRLLTAPLIALDNWLINLTGIDKDLELGDVVGVSRGTYQHYGIYIGEGRVVHYVKDRGSLLDGIIAETSFAEFLVDERKYFVTYFTPDQRLESKIKTRALLGALSAWSTLWRLWDRMVNRHNYHVFSPEETVERARKKIGERRYSLFRNNCEHFAIWCKTGLAESSQVEAILFLLPRLQHRPQSATG